ncbi:hypothetical protein [Bacillus thuringiensis]|uniref:hypothetical protein n=1 Tax=Bacillus thuringiensis TaxID=1428 RepID=UPI003F6A6451
MEPIIEVSSFIVKGSVWESKQGREIIEKEIGETLRIWDVNVGLNIKLNEPSTLSNGQPNKKLTKADLTEFAQDLKASELNIVVIFTNKSITISRAFTEPSLVKENKPVIIVGKKVFDKPGTFRDLAHELGHVFLRFPGHEGGPEDLMALGKGPNLGDNVSQKQKEKAKKYPNN